MLNLQKEWAATHRRPLLGTPSDEEGGLQFADTDPCAAADGSSHEHLGQYLLIKRLGYGGVAEVWLAQREDNGSLHRRVAIKRLLPHLRQEANLVRSLLDEARLAARIVHPNVVQIFDVGKHQDMFYVVMEYLDGVNLAHLVISAQQSGRQLPPQLSAYIVVALCRGLHHAHELSDEQGRPLCVIHRDVKPQNVMLLRDGSIKLLDFGVAKARARLAQTTHVESIKGTYAYMSPEQHIGRPLDRRSDVFSAAVVLWELLSGRNLFHRATPHATLRSLLRDRVDPPSTFNSAVPNELDELVLKGLSLAPDARFQSAREMADALERSIYRAVGPPSGAQGASEHGYRLAVPTRQNLANAINWAMPKTTVPRLTVVPPLKGSCPAHREPPLSPGHTEAATETTKDKSPVSVGNEIGRRQRWRRVIAPAVAVITVSASLMLLTLEKSPPQLRAATKPTGAADVPKQGELVLTSTPADAHVWLDDEPQQRTTPLRSLSLQPGDHRLRVRLAGYLTWAGRVAVSAGQTLRVHADLLPSAKTATPPTPSVSNAAAGGPRSSTRLSHNAAGVTRPRHARQRRGWLNLVTTPWAEIFWRHQSLGPTPLVRVPLPAGRRRLRAVNHDRGIAMEFDVVIQDKQVTRTRQGLD